MLWARQNPSIAQGCLHLPSINAASRASIRPKINSFDDYWSFRGWEWPSTGADYAKTLVSHVLSAPLTIASTCLSSSQRSRTRRWGCIGARAEASLPVMYWRESLIMLLENPSTDPRSCQYHLDFVGPDTVRHPDVTLLFHHGSPFSLTLKWFRPGLFHERIETDRIEDYDGFILLNPGLGHPFLREDWLPTMEVILKSQKPILVTAHSDLDVQREKQCWEDTYGVSNFQYQVNPFASRLTYRDPLEETVEHWVSPNFAVALYDPST